jgi:MFS family permease
LIPLYADVVLKLGTADIGYAISFATFTNLLVTIPFGHALDRFGRKIVLVPSLAMLAIASLVFPYVGGFLPLVLACIFLGVGEGGTAQAPLTLASDATMDEPHGVSMAVYRVFGDLGYVVGPIMIGVLSDLFGLSFPFYAVSALIIVSTVLVQLFAKEIYKRKK